MMWKNWFQINRNRSVQSQVMQRVALVLVVAFAAFAVLSISLFYTSIQRDLEQQNQKALGERSAKIGDIVEEAVLEAQSIANRASAVAFAREAQNQSNPTSDTLIEAQKQLSSEFLQSISLNLDIYTSLRFVTLTGSVWTEAVNQAGILGNNTLIRPSELKDDFSFKNTINRTEVTLSPITLTTTALGESEFLLQIFAPVVDVEAGGQVVGVIGLSVSAGAILDVVNGPLGQTDQRWVLVNNQGYYLADSAASRLQSGKLAQNTYKPVTQFEPELAALLDQSGGEVSLATLGGSAVSSVLVSPGKAPDMPWQLMVLDNNGLASRGLYSGSLVLILISLGGCALAIALINSTLNTRLKPLQMARFLARQLAEGDVDDTVPPSSSNDEVGQLQESFKRISTRMRGLSEQVNTQVQRHNAALDMAARISHETAALSETSDLLSRVIELICNEFELYHAQVFMLDDIGLNAVLVYSRGVIGQELLEENIKVLVGSRSMIGSVTASGKALVIDDTRISTELPYAAHPLLSETRAEIVLPLSVSNQVIGALDLHSRNPRLFGGEEVRIFQMLADELAIALHKNRQLAQSEQRVVQSDALNRRLTRIAWEETEQRVGLADAYRYNLVDVRPIPANEGGEIEAISAPITIRGEVIGTIAAVAPEGLPFAEGDHAILRAVADRIGLTIEGARLFQETQNNLAITSTLYQLSRQLNEADQLEDVIEGIVISAASDAMGGQVWLFDDYGVGALPEWIELASEWWFSQQAQKEASTPGMRLPIEDSIFLTGLEENKIKVVADIEHDQRLDSNLKTLFAKIESKSLVNIPFNVRGQWRGILMLHYAQARSFSETEGRIYTALIEQAGVAIDNRLLLRQTEMTLNQIERLYAASRIINAAQNFTELLRAATAATISASLDFDLGILEGPLDKEGWPTVLRKVARTVGGQITDMDTVISMEIPVASPLRRRDPLVVEGNELAPGFQAIFPLFSANQPIALLYLRSAETNTLASDDFEIYKALAGQMSTVLENQRLLEQTASALDETRRLYQASRDIASAQDSKTVYQVSIAHLAHSADNLSRVSILLAGPDPTLHAAYFDLVHVWERLPNPSSTLPGRIDAESAPFASLAGEKNEAVYYPNIEIDLADNQRMRLALNQAGGHSVIVAPMRSQRSWFGVLICESQETGAFSEQYVRFVQAVTNQIAVAVENRALFDEAQMEAQRALALAEVGQLATRIGTEFEGNISEVFNRVAEPANYDRWLLMLLNETNPRLLEKVAMRLPNYMEETTDLSLNLDMAQHSIADSVRERQTLIVNDPSKYPAFMSANSLTLEGIGKHIATPLYIGGSIVGALLVGRGLDRADLDERDEQLVHTLAAQIAVAIENRRLYQAAESEREYLRSIMETIPTGIIVLDPHSFVPIQANDQAKELLRKPISLQLPFSITHYNLIRTGTNVHYPSEEMPIFVAAATASEAFADDLAVVHDDGSQTDILINAAPISDALGNVIAIVAGLQDISNLRGLENALQQNLREQISLYETTRALAEASDVEEALDATIAQLVMMEPLDGYIVLLNEKTGDLQPMRGIFSPEQFNLPQEIFQADMLLIPRLEETDILESDIKTVLETMSVKALVTLPLRARDNLMGWVAIVYDRSVDFSPDTERFLTTLADNAAVAIDNRNLYRSTELAFDEATILYETSRALSSATTPDEIVNAVAIHLKQHHLSQVFMAVPSQASPKGDILEVVATWIAEDSAGIDLLGVTLSADQFPPWRLASASEITTIDDVLTDYRLDEMEKLGLQSTDTRSLVILPLKVGTNARSVAVIWMASSKPYQHTDRDLRIYRSFIEQASLSMEATRLLEQTERRARQLATSAQVSQIASSILDLNQLLSKVVDVIQESFGYDHVQIFLLDQFGEYAELRASTGEAGRQLLAINHKLLKGSRSVIGQVTENGQSVLALDTADTRVVHKPNPYLPLTRSEMALPLVIQEEIVGALDVQSNTPNAFSDEDLAVLTTLAAQISVAIDNARLFEQAEMRARDMGFLFNVTAAASTPDQNLNMSLQNVADLVRASLETLNVTIYLAEEYTTPDGQDHTLLRPAALSGSEQPLSEIAEIYISDEQNFLSIAVAGRQAMIIDDIEAESRYLPISTYARSAVVAPLIAGNDMVGIIVLEDRHPAAYTDRTVRLLVTLTNSLSAVIQSARLLEQVRRNNEQLRELDRLKSDFLANMSHELRTPLNSIIGFSRVILKGIDGPLTEMQEQDLNTIYNSGSHLLGLINDILDQAKINSGKMDLHSDYFDMKPLVEGVRSIGIGLVRDKPIDMKLDVASGLPKAYGDEFRTRQILLNLVSNATKFTQKGSVSIRVYTEINEDINAPMIRVDVQDTGIGIAEKDIPLLFEAFRQVDSSLTRTVGGTGLGLPIAKSLIEMQNGKLLVYSEMNVGSTFSILIPTEPMLSTDNAAPDEQAARKDSLPTTGPLPALNIPAPKFDPPPKHQQSDDRSPAKTSDTVETNSAKESRSLPSVIMPTKRQILLVEDSPDMVDQVRRALQREGFDIFTASFPLEAEAMVSGLHPTLIIMNADFHKGASWEIISRLKARDDAADIPVIMLALTDESERANQAGVFSFIQRPFLPEQLTEAVRRAEAESQTDRILIIDDQPESTRLLKEALDNTGQYRVFAAHSGLEGISMIARRRPDLVILDLRMPEMDGFAVLQELQGNPETASIPIVVVTADALNPDEQGQVADLQVVYKTDLNQDNYGQFISSVKSKLSNGNGH